jgi:hypothetical protein
MLRGSRRVLGAALLGATAAAATVFASDARRPRAGDRAARGPAARAGAGAVGAALAATAARAHVFCQSDDTMASAAAAHELAMALADPAAAWLAAAVETVSQRR